MNAIFQALNSGYPPEKILAFLSKAAPDIGNTIFKAQSAGYTVKQILGFLAKTTSESDTKGLSNPEIQARNSRVETEMLKNGLTMTAGAIGAASLSRSAASVLGQNPLAKSTRGTPNAPGTSPLPPTPTPSTPQAPQQTAPTRPSQSTQNAPISSQPPVSPSPQQPPMSQAPIVAQPPKTINPKEILDTSKATQQVQKMLETGNDPNQVGGYFRKFHQATVNQVEKEAGKPFEEVVEGFAKENPSIQAKKPEITVQAQPEKSIEKVEKEKPVFTPSGKGVIKEISGDNALIEEDGKLKQHKLDKVIQTEISEDDLANLYEDLKKGIEKHTGKQISRNVESAGYDPKNNELVYKPHGSDKFYVYDDISPEDAESLTNLLTQRKSTGENFIGAWESGTESPIGAAMYQLIKKLQAERGGKGNEYKNRFETIYDALEPAKEALKKRYAEQKRKEREAKPKKAKKPRVD